MPVVLVCASCASASEDDDDDAHDDDDRHECSWRDDYGDSDVNDDATVDRGPV